MANDTLRVRLAVAMEEVAVQRHQMCMQERAQEESQTSVRAFALNELRSIELAQHRADISTRDARELGGP